MEIQEEIKQEIFSKTIFVRRIPGKPENYLRMALPHFPQPLVINYVEDFPNYSIP